VRIALNFEEPFLAVAMDRLTREFGMSPFPRARNLTEACGTFLMEAYQLWDNRHGSADIFVKLRLSLIELLFRLAEQQIETPGSIVSISPVIARAGSHDNRHGKEAIRAAIQELNTRFRAANFPFCYHNGLIQFADDNLVQDQIAEPFWTVTRDPKWKNVDDDMKRAIDLADTGGHDPVWYASKALESAIKIISDEKGWTTGNEKGAAAYVNNLVSAKNGRFIEVWEKDALLWFFATIRNPHGHGPGSVPPLVLSDHQTRWAIEVCMSWIKSLIRRM
jgi:hypothetical protein